MRSKPVARRLAKGKGNCRQTRDSRSGHRAPGVRRRARQTRMRSKVIFSPFGCVQAALKYRVLMCGKEKTEKGYVEP